MQWTLLLIIDSHYENVTETNENRFFALSMFVAQPHF